MTRLTKKPNDELRSNMALAHRMLNKLPTRSDMIAYLQERYSSAQIAVLCDMANSSTVINSTESSGARDVRCIATMRLYIECAYLQEDGPLMPSNHAKFTPDNIIIFLKMLKKIPGRSGLFKLLKEVHTAPELAVKLKLASTTSVFRAESYESKSEVNFLNIIKLYVKERYKEKVNKPIENI